jgi:hypothetical protein
MTRGESMRFRAFGTSIAAAMLLAPATAMAIN